MGFRLFGSGALTGFRILRVWRLGFQSIQFPVRAGGAGKLGMSLEICP